MWTRTRRRWRRRRTPHAAGTHAADHALDPDLAEFAGELAPHVDCDAEAAIPEELRDLELLSSPVAHGKRLTQLASCTWIDTHLHDTAAFVCAGVEELHLQYVQFSERAARAALKALDKYLGNADDNAGDRVRESEAAAFTEAASVLLQLAQSQ